MSPSIGLFAIMQDEIDYVDRWAATVRQISGIFDRALVVDGGSKDRTVERLRELGFEVVTREFPHHFSRQRNHGVELMNTDWVFELDADELMSPPLLGGLRQIVDDAIRAKQDVVGIPRLNFIDGTLVASPGHKGLDYQYRLHRADCHWRGVVHEEVTGYRARYELNILDGHFILHDKTSARHNARNEYYRTLTP